MYGKVEIQRVLPYSVCVFCGINVIAEFRLYRLPLARGQLSFPLSSKNLASRLVSAGQLNHPIWNQILVRIHEPRI